MWPILGLSEKGLKSAKKHVEQEHRSSAKSMVTSSLVLGAETCSPLKTFFFSPNVPEDDPTILQSFWNPYTILSNTFRVYIFVVIKWVGEGTVILPYHFCLWNFLGILQLLGSVRVKQNRGDLFQYF